MFSWVKTDLTRPPKHHNSVLTDKPNTSFQFKTLGMVTGHGVRSVVTPFFIFLLSLFFFNRSPKVESSGIKLIRTSFSRGFLVDLYYCFSPDSSIFVSVKLWVCSTDCVSMNNEKTQQLFVRNLFLHAIYEVYLFMLCYLFWVEWQFCWTKKVGSGTRHRFKCKPQGDLRHSHKIRIFQKRFL